MIVLYALEVDSFHVSLLRPDLPVHADQIIIPIIITIAIKSNGFRKAKISSTGTPSSLIRGENKKTVLSLNIIQQKQLYVN